MVLAASKAAQSTAASTHTIGGDTNREVVLDGLNRSVPRVAHVGVQGAQPVESRSGPHAATQRLVVRESPAATWVDAAKRHIVHRALARGRDPIRQRVRQRAEYDVGDALRGLDVAAGHRRRPARIDYGPLGRCHGERPGQPVVVQDVLTDEAPQGVETRGPRDGKVRVHAAGGLPGRAPEVDVNGP